MPDFLAAVGVGAGKGDRLTDSLPFSGNDATAGSESELQVVVCGDRGSVDLPLCIEQSNYFANVTRRVQAGDSPKRIISSLERYLKDNPSRIWENSWVRFPKARLTQLGRETLKLDLMADKSDPSKAWRSDADEFLFQEKGEEFVRVPISYLLKLALAEAVGSQPNAPVAFQEAAFRLMPHFLNDNTSPETHSFHVVPLSREVGLGRALAREAAKRFLLSQLLLMYANLHLGLLESGQKAMVYFAPHPPTRQRELNNCISDSFYRELFMSPCLSGWDCGEQKRAYMNLCHQVLSRSQLNAISKLREAGIIANNLVVLPNASNISLANNGTHVSLGSRRLTKARQENHPDFGAAEEKRMGDLTIKIVEHFLPLLVGTYTAAPYRFDFTDFHPENVLGFLPHELDYTHLRMIWRRWKRKAQNRIFGQPVTPMGPRWLDFALSKLFGLRGDYVTDFRMIDYLVSLLSTHRSPALDGAPGNGERLKRDLAALGIFDTHMSLYLLYRLREYEVFGFTGFEGRYYSAFESFSEDLGQAVDLQVLITALAYKYQLRGDITHSDIPDNPSVESERRQIIFGTAIGIPTFYVQRDSSNWFLRKIIKCTKRTRTSRRYPGFTRVHNIEYRKTLVEIILEDAPDLVESLGLQETLDNLKLRLDVPGSASAEGRLVRGILGAGSSLHAMNLSAREFNSQAEAYYREELRVRQIKEAFGYLRDDVKRLINDGVLDRETIGECMRYCLDQRAPGEFLDEMENKIAQEHCSEENIQKLINLLLLSITHDCTASETILGESKSADHPALLY